jgi:hypothetical protein
MISELDIYAHWPEHERLKFTEAEIDSLRLQPHTKALLLRFGLPKSCELLHIIFNSQLTAASDTDEILLANGPGNAKYILTCSHKNQVNIRHRSGIIFVNSGLHEFLNCIMHFEKTQALRRAIPRAQENQARDMVNEFNRIIREVDSDLKNQAGFWDTVIEEMEYGII